MNIFTLYAHRTDYEDKFIESFSSIEKLLMYLTNHPEVVKDAISEFEIDPI